MRTRQSARPSRLCSAVLLLIAATQSWIPLSVAQSKSKQRATRLHRASPAPSVAPGREQNSTSSEPATIDILDGIRTGQIAASAEGRSDGRITLSIANKTSGQLRVVLPPGLMVSGASGQFGGGMGGMGGGMGGMGGGMGGMGGGMGGMGGGMGGMGGGMGGMGGGMGGRGMGGGSMPPMMGMMMLSRMIMYLCGDYDSWDQRAMAMGMGGMGGMGMGGMGGGGMGGMGGGMGGMGGMRSVPPTGPLEATLQPKQVRHLPTSVVSLNGPGRDSMPSRPQVGERLRISGVEDWTDEKRTLTALKRLAEVKAPPSVAQMILWYVTAGASWDDVGRLCQGWGNAGELGLARDFVARLDRGEVTNKPDEPDSGILYWQLKSESEKDGELISGVRSLWTRWPVLGLTAKEGIPDAPGGPAIACTVTLTEQAIELKLSASHPKGSDWMLIDRFSLEQLKAESVYGEPAVGDSTAKGGTRISRKAVRLADQLAGGMVAHLVRLKLARGPREHGKETFRIKIINDSPLILNGLAVSGPGGEKDGVPSMLFGLSLPPQKTLTVPASADAVRRLHLKEGPRVVAADLSGL